MQALSASRRSSRLYCAAPGRRIGYHENDPFFTIWACLNDVTRVISESRLRSQPNLHTTRLQLSTFCAQHHEQIPSLLAAQDSLIVYDLIWRRLKSLTTGRAGLDGTNMILHAAIQVAMQFTYADNNRLFPTPSFLMSRYPLILIITRYDSELFWRN